MPLSGHEVRRLFLEFFQSKGHTRIASSPLIPKGDASLMFVNAGMVPFKNVFTGEENIGETRAASCQKCLRVSGKHNDFESVGRTARHHTFFEMLGNFSFGDYFRRDAICFAWELLTEVYGLPKDRLWVTVFEEDDDAAVIWEAETDIPSDRIVRKGIKDNYWSMGDTGPNGPSSEIFIDQGPEMIPGTENETIYGDSDRFLELWNLVFMQYNTSTDGTKTPLPRPCIDTGMGLERITAVLQGKANNYESDLFAPVISIASEIAGVTYGIETEKDVSLRVVSDHIRAMTFLIADGVLPSNEGRGYVLRRIIRRAARHGVLLGIEEPFLHRVSCAVVDEMKDAYPELVERQVHIAQVIGNEEERFLRTLVNGMKVLSDAIAGIKERKELTIPGALAFKLHDTFGFPVDLTQDIARDHGLSIDEAGFSSAMERQRIRSAAAWRGTGALELSAGVRALAARGVLCEFVGYDNLVAESEVLGLIVGGVPVDSVNSGAEVELVSTTTPFYAEMGGQVGDRGTARVPGGTVMIEDTRMPIPGLIVHRGRVVEGTVCVGQKVRLSVEESSRRSIQRNHTATHLLHEALRKTLGENVKQAGSLVAPDRMRFDFTYYQRVDERTLAEVESRVNAHIRANRPVSFTLMKQKQALEEGAIALFGEKYEDTVRVVDIDGISRELCGGTHVNATGEIGLFRIVSEGAIAAGVRRIEALTGEGAYKHDLRMERALRETADRVRTQPLQVPERVDKLLAEVQRLERELARRVEQDASERVVDMAAGAREVGGVRFLATMADVDHPKKLRDFAVKARDRLGSSVVLVGWKVEGRANLVCTVSHDLTGRFQADNIIRGLSPLIGGTGGGKPDLAEAGGRNPDGLSAAFERFYDLTT